jgi:uncharacterized protein (TIGR02466 family)
MKENLDVNNYFSTPVYTGEILEWVDTLNKASDSFIEESKKRNKSFLKDRNKKLKKNLDDFAIVNHSTSLIDVSDFFEFKKYIEERSLEILDHMGYDLKKHILYWSEFWVQEFGKKGGGSHEGHIHHNSHISGFYFLKCSDRTSFPIFHDPRPGKLMTQLPLKNEKEINEGTSIINFRPKPGSLIMFPSYLEHQFSVDFGIDTFRFIHFNIQAVEKQILNINKNEL